MGPNFKEAVISLYEVDSNSQQLLESFKLVDADKIKKCQEIIDQMRVDQEKLKYLFNYSNKDRENIAALLGTQAPSISRDPQADKNAAELKEHVKKAQEALDQAICLKWAEESKVDMCKVNIGQAEELLEVYQKRIDELSGEVERLRVNK